jgi:dihydropteroate synthase
MRGLTDYGDDLCQTVVDELRDTVASLCRLGDAPMLESALRPRLIFDPGLGFAKTAEQSLLLLGKLHWLSRSLGGRLLIGASRKSMLGAITGLPINERVVPSAVAAALAAYQGADIVRVHDVAETVAALQVAEALRCAARTDAEVLAGEGGA